MTALALAFFFSSLSTPVRADTQQTRIASASAAPYGANAYTITGRLENRSNAEPVTWTPLKISERIVLSWFTDVNPTVILSIGEAWTDSTGIFSYLWYYELEPGSSYRILMNFAGDTISSTTFSSCSSTVSLYIPLMLSVVLDSPTMNVLQDDVASTGVTATVDNSKTAHTISLSTPSWPSNVYGSAAFSATQGTSSAGNPFKSSLRITVKNQTQPGTYYITVAATAETGATSQTTLTLYVQQNTYTIYVTIQGLPSNIATKIYADKIRIADVRGDRTVSLVVSNKTMTISVLREPPSGNSLTLYVCEDNVKPALDESSVRVAEFTFGYLTKYASKFTANVAPDLTLTLKLQVGNVEIQKTFKPTQGCITEFYPAGTKLMFTILPSYIPTENDVNYRFNTWKNEKGEVLVANLEGLYEIVLDHPYDLKAIFDRYVSVKAIADPSEVPVLHLQIGLKGSEKKVVDVGGPVALSAGEYPAESVLEFSLDQNQYIMTNSKADTRYVFDAFSTSNEVLLKKHLTITIRYKVYYKLSVFSEFPEAVIQPRGGEAWYLKGSLATIQATPEAWGVEIINGWKPIRYLFDHWAGAIESNRTQPYPFAVLQPMEIRAFWKLDLKYLAMISAAISGTVAASALALKKLVVPKARMKLQERRAAKKIAPIGLAGLKEEDMRVFNCIDAKRGALKWSEIVKELGMSRKQIEESVERLKSARILVVNQRSSLTTADSVVRNYLKLNKGRLKWSEAVKELGMSKEQIEESLRRLKEAKMSETVE